MRRVRELTESDKILSANTIGAGGVFISVVKMAVGNLIGALLHSLDPRELTDESYGSLLFEIDAEEDAGALFGGLDYREIGETVDSNAIEIRPFRKDDTSFENAVVSGNTDSVIIGLGDVLERWERPLKSVFPTETKTNLRTIENPVMESVEKISYGERSNPVKASTAPQSAAFAKPRVFIPVFPGTNCEVDTRIAFEHAGAIVDTINLVNQDERTLNESIRRMTAAIQSSQIIMIPGGFSAGDEPEGSAKYITSVFRNPYITEAVTDLLEQRDGLMLGICNGFQALIKLGLVPYGRITAPSETAPTLTYNTIGRHMSRIVRTRVASTLSPWLAEAAVDEVYTMPVSHGEGRFVASDDVLESLIQGGQIATQYVNYEGNPTMDIRHNPNGSVLAVEGITSPDGRIFGKMGHAERVGRDLYKNVPGNYDTGIFRAGVKYFG
jgi:phosphoribosylformylglycinamidine synthase